MQVAIGTTKLDGTPQAVTAGQAREILPLWQTLQVLESSDTAATEEKDAQVAQIQDAMSKEQTLAITALNLTRRDMASVMPSQVQTFGGTQNSGQQWKKPWRRWRRFCGRSPTRRWRWFPGQPRSAEAGHAVERHISKQRHQRLCHVGTQPGPGTADPGRH
jgi:hypothetical protein